MPRTLELAIDGTSRNGADGEVRVRRDHEFIRVTWFCGDERSFTKEEASSAIDYFERIAKVPNVPLAHKDYNAEKYVGLIDEEGFFHGGDHLGDDGGKVPWKELRQAVKALL